MADRRPGAASIAGWRDDRHDPHVTEGQIVAVAWGPLAVILGSCFVTFRHRLSRRSVARHGARGQQPRAFAAGGAFFVVAGIAVLIGGAAAGTYLATRTGQHAFDCTAPAAA